MTAPNPVLAVHKCPQANYVFTVIRQEVIPQIIETHGQIDRRLIFQIANNSTKPLIVHGKRIDGKLDPMDYLLKYDAPSGVWQYPERNGKPLKWKRMSSIDRESQVLQPGQSLEFWMLFGTWPSAEGGKRLKITARVSCKPGKEPFELRSDEFAVK
jgi:hypothetical protein